MSNRDLIKAEIDILPDEMINFVQEFIGVLKNYKINSNENIIDKNDTVAENYKNLLKFKGTLKRNVDIKKERLDYLDEKYNNFS